MIGNITQGTGFGGCVRYCAEKKGASLSATNMLGETPAELSKEFNQTRDLYEGRAKKIVFHVSLNPAKGDVIKNPRHLAEDYMREMKMDPQKHEYCLYKHTDTGRVHYHLIANRISRGGREVWNDRFSKLRNMDVMRKLERKYCLRKMQHKEHTISKPQHPCLRMSM